MIKENRGKWASQGLNIIFIFSIIFCLIIPTSIDNVMSSGIENTDRLYPPIVYLSLPGHIPQTIHATLPEHQHSRYDGYTSIFNYEIGDKYYATYVDNQQVTHFYYGDYASDSITEIIVDTNLSTTEIILPIDYGVIQQAADLDDDGNIELIIQRGDSGSYGNGYIDIHSAPTWEHRARFSFHEKKMIMSPCVVNVDDDPYLELYVDPSGHLPAEHDTRIVLINYNPNTDQFYMEAQYTTDSFLYGTSAVGDFDEDGKIEFITGNFTSYPPPGYQYELFEYDNGLQYRGHVGVQGFGATVASPYSDGHLYPLCGYIDSQNSIMRYYLLQATGDNTFIINHTFEEPVCAGCCEDRFWNPICHALDSNNDTRDEMVMNFFPSVKLFEWIPETESFSHTWSWNQNTLGWIEWWGETNLDRDDYHEWCPTTKRPIEYWFIRAYEFEYDQEPMIVNCHGPYEGYTGQPITFTGSVVGGTPPYTWKWSFGDGTTSQEQYPTHIYTAGDEYLVNLTVTDYNNHEAWNTTEALIIQDQTPPQLTINKPSPALYLHNRKIVSFFMPLIIGPIDINVSVIETESGIRTVNLSIDGHHITNWTEDPFTWMWNETAFFRHTISVTATDRSENSVTTDIVVWKFF